MIRIVLVRPGSTDYDDQGRIQGSLSIPLNSGGVDEVQRMVPQLKNLGTEAVYCPDCDPALQTATMLAAALDVKLKKLEGMCNLNHGLWQGKLIDEVKRQQPKVYRQWSEQPDSVCPPEGETVGDVRERAGAAVAKLMRKHKQGTIALVLPEPVASIVRSILGHGELGDLWHACEEHGRSEVIELDAAAADHSGVWRGVVVEAHAHPADGKA
ncbi:MAG TPA: histidine phosphatase family protein [Pirellulales bacterium]|jgi:broad specificity phosphatase PhoE|nr:histidine phosphatase family protein [Pirellulales bacterium]